MLPTLAVILLIVTSLSLLVTRDWRLSIIALAIQYIGVMILVSLQWPFGIAMIKLVAGWMAGAALGLTRIGQTEVVETETSWPSSQVFRLLAGALVLLVVYPTAPKVLDWLPGVSLEQIWGGLVLLGIGLVQLGMTAQPFRVVLGLLTCLAGFEILYARVEVSLLVAGLLSGVNLGLATIGAYLLNSAIPEEQI